MEGRRRTRRIGDEDVELVLDDRVPAGYADLESVARLISTIRSSGLQAPDPDLEARHVTAMLGVAPVPGPRSPLPRGTLGKIRVAALRTAAVALVTGASATSLAYAGVDLPGTVTERFFNAALGVELPNQAPLDKGDLPPDENGAAVIPLVTDTPSPHGNKSSDHRDKQTLKGQAKAEATCTRAQAKTSAPRPRSQAKADAKCARAQGHTAAAAERAEERAARRSSKQQQKTEARNEREQQREDEKAARDQRKEERDIGKKQGKHSKDGKEPRPKTD